MKDTKDEDEVEEVEKLVEEGVRLSIKTAKH